MSPLSSPHLALPVCWLSGLGFLWVSHSRNGLVESSLVDPLFGIALLVSSSSCAYRFLCVPCCLHLLLPHLLLVLALRISALLVLLSHPILKPMALHLLDMFDLHLGHLRAAASWPPLHPGCVSPPATPSGASSPSPSSPRALTPRKGRGVRRHVTDVFQLVCDSGLLHGGLDDGGLAAVRRVHHACCVGPRQPLEHALVLRLK
ncbi:hypothetical protein C2E23DRAFT_861278 [Lenzites betulinus]|nr:hypothetical protein C2E23DRAFT_861278 [Lenzites betulinus]